jgi:ABC-type lipoprotein export system ATPase subunit
MLIELQQVIPTPLPKKIIESSEVWNLNLVIKPQSRILISAQSGMGKSTLLHLIYGLRDDYQGRLLIDGQYTRDLTYKNWVTLRRRNISLIFQDLRLFPHLSARENLILIPDPNPSSPSIDEMAERLGMHTFLDQSVYTLSHGQRQRIAIIRALLKPFQLLLLDEPFSHLDEENQSYACELIQEITDKNNAGIILSSLGTDPNLKFDKRYSL